MPGVILDGRKFANKVIEGLKNKVSELSLKPRLAVVLVGDNPASRVYVRNKQIKAEYAGFDFSLIHLPFGTSEENLIELIHTLNDEEKIDAIMVQLPLPEHISQERVLETVAPYKDADGFTSYNIGKLAAGYKPYSIPCTPKGIIKLLDEYDIKPDGKNALVIGRSLIVGKPVAMLFNSRNATVSVAHSHTKDLPNLISNADIVIAAIGKSEFITGDMIKPGAVVIDVGINKTPEGLKGDVHFETAYEKASFITPVPGGIGPVTVAMLLENTFELYELKNKFF